MSRSVVALDADNATSSFVVDAAAELGCALACYTTWSHTPEAPRWRLLAPLSRAVAPDEYRSIVLALTATLGYDQFDAGSAQPERLMYRPSDNGHYTRHVVDGPPLAAERWLERAEEAGVTVRTVDRPRHHDDSPERTESGLHPYAEAGIRGELARLDALTVPWAEGDHWDRTTFEVACNLREFANSRWSGYTLDQAEADLYEHAPCDDAWGAPQHAAKWASAESTVGDGARPEPGGSAADDFAGQEVEPPRKGIHVRTTAATQFSMRPVRWAWDGYLPAGMLSLLGGREGIGKSCLAYDRTALLTRGTLPGVHWGQPRAVLVCATEDSWEHTIVPRLVAAGADLTRVLRVEAVEGDLEVGLLLPRDLAELERVAKQEQAALLLLDPLLSRLDGKLDTHKDAEVRRALEPLVVLADRTGCAVLGLIHVNKSGGTDALNTLMGSRAFAAVARSVLFCAKDPDDDGGQILGHPKCNVGRLSPTLRYQLDGVQVAKTQDGEVWAPRVVWGEATETTVADALEEPSVRTATAEAVRWLRQFLHDAGECVESAKVKEAGKKDGHAGRTLDKARRRAGVQFQDTGEFPRKTLWCLEDWDLL